jgi:uncharacterized membrane protein
MVWYVLLGISTGMRTMTATAVLCWFAWLRLLPQDGWAFWAGNLVSVIVFTLLALGEYVGDTLPSTPSRTQAPLVLGRVAFACLAGALAAHGTVEPAAGGIVFAAIGSLVGTYGGYHLRMALARRVGRDLPVALSESALALVLALFAAAKLHEGFASQVVQSIVAPRFHA